MDVTPEVPPKSYRRLTLGDLIGLVAVCAVGWGGASFVRQTEELLGIPPQVWTKNPYEWFVLGSIQLLILAWFVVLRGFRWSRSERLQPGYVACLAVLVTSGFEFAVNLSENWRVQPVSYHELSLARRLLYAYLTVPTGMGSTAIAAAMLTAWLILILAGGLRRSTAALEHLGRMVACGFLAAFVVYHFCSSLLDI